MLNLVHTNISLQNSIGPNPTLIQNAILSLMKIKTKIRSLPVKELSNSATLYLYSLVNNYWWFIILSLYFYNNSIIAYKLKTITPNEILRTTFHFKNCVCFINTRIAKKKIPVSDMIPYSGGRGEGFIQESPNKFQGW